VVERVSGIGPVVLAGHGDAGAAAVTRVANAAPDRIRHLVYLAAYLCVDRATIGEYLELPENSGALLAPVVETPPELGVARVNWRAGDPETLVAFRAALAADQSEEAFRATLASLSPDVGVRLWGEDLQVNAATWGRIPRTYVRFTEDRTFPVALQDRMIAEADRLAPDTAFAVHSVPAPHVGPLDRPEIVQIFTDLAGKSTS
jgi:pimeloyl-ACP methyl ester carboxylesterase